MLDRSAIVKSRTDASLSVVCWVNIFGRMEFKRVVAKKTIVLGCKKIKHFEEALAFESRRRLLQWFENTEEKEAFHYHRSREQSRQDLSDSE